MLTLRHKTFINWKEYIEDKFSDKSLFVFEQFDKENSIFLSHRVTSSNTECQTEIIIQLFIDNNFLEVFDIQFNHPDSPVWKAKHEAEKYGWDGQGTDFTLENLIRADNWMDVPVYNGWTETTFFFDNVEVQTMRNFI